MNNKHSRLKIKPATHSKLHARAKGKGQTAYAVMLAKLLAELKAAVRAGNRKYASQLVSEIISLHRNTHRAYAGTKLELKREALLKHRIDMILKGVDKAALLSRLGTPSMCAKPPSMSEVQSASRGVTKKNAMRITRSAHGTSVTRVTKFTPTQTVPGCVWPVWFGTNRLINEQGDGFTDERTENISRGRVDVFIPQAHHFGEIDSSFWKKLFRCDLRDDKLQIQRLERQEYRTFINELRATTRKAAESGNTSHALLYIHGFNVTFENAAIRAAQIGCDLAVKGTTAFFSWPSQGAFHSYIADGDTIETSEQAITDFIVDFAANCGAEKVHVVAHSMGNRGLLHALQRIAGNAEMKGKVKLGQVFLAAPDIGRAQFLELAHLYPEFAERTTLYASKSDLMLWLSGWLHGAPRAGYFLPYTIAPGVDTIAVPYFDVDFLGHRYIPKAAALLNDMYDLISHNVAPDLRQRLYAADADGHKFWKLRK